MKKNAPLNTGISAQPRMKPSIGQATRTNALQNMIKNVPQFMIRNAKQRKCYLTLIGMRGNTFISSSFLDKLFSPVMKN